MKRESNCKNCGAALVISRPDCSYCGTAVQPQRHGGAENLARNVRLAAYEHLRIYSNTTPGPTKTAAQSGIDVLAKWTKADPAFITVALLTSMAITALRSPPGWPEPEKTYWNKALDWLYKKGPTGAIIGTVTIGGITVALLILLCVSASPR